MKYEIATVTASRICFANILPNVNKCENGWSNFPASFRVVALKLTELIRFALPNEKSLLWPGASHVLENLLPQSVGSIINYLQWSTEAAQWGTPSCSRQQPATDNLVSDVRSNLLVAPHPHEQYQRLLQLQAWVSAHGVLKDCMIKVYLWSRILMKY